VLLFEKCVEGCTRRIDFRPFRSGFFFEVAAHRKQLAAISCSFIFYARSDWLRAFKASAGIEVIALSASVKLGSAFETLSLGVRSRLKDGTAHSAT
jgi:hypothetical protein